MSKWKIVATQGGHLICGPHCGVMGMDPARRLVTHHRSCRAFTCGRRTHTLSEAIGFVEVELILAEANILEERPEVRA